MCCGDADQTKEIWIQESDGRWNKCLERPPFEWQAEMEETFLFVHKTINYCSAKFTLHLWTHLYCSRFVSCRWTILILILQYFDLFFVLLKYQKYLKVKKKTIKMIYFLITYINYERSTFSCWCLMMMRNVLNVSFFFFDISWIILKMVNKNLWN